MLCRNHDHFASVGCPIQCNLLAVPPLKKLQCKNDIFFKDMIEESLPSEVEETDLDNSFQEDTTTE